jgi:hypothetical protein
MVLGVGDATLFQLVLFRLYIYIYSYKDSSFECFAGGILKRHCEFDCSSFPAGSLGTTVHYCVQTGFTDHFQSPIFSYHIWWLSAFFRNTIQTQIFIHIWVLNSMNTCMYTLLLWPPPKDWAGLILRFMKSVTKSVSLSTGTSPPTERIISRKCNTHIKFRI